jgi:Phage integrase SAM-like domain
MATINAVILPHQKKTDGTWNVKIRVKKESTCSFIATTHFINSKQIRKDNSIKDSIILAMIEPVLTEYRKKVGELGPKLSMFNAKQLASYLSGKNEVKAENINVIAFGRKRVKELQDAGRDASAKNMQTVINGLVDYFGSDNVRITEIRANMLIKYEAYLRQPRKQTREDQFKIERTRTIPGMTATGLHNHMRDLRILFNNIKDFYNDEDANEIVVKHYPFKKYKLVPPALNEKPKLTISQIAAIRDYKAKPGTRIEQARDLFMLSFYLCGMNAVDLRKMPPLDKSNPRVGYKRSKTSSRRRDQAFISINIPEVANHLYSKYSGTLQHKYVDHSGLDHALSFGLKKIGAALKIEDLEFYDARHAFGDLARNKCRFSKDDVALALNHKDQSTRVTDVYIGKNWDIIDDVQSGVISLFENLDRERDELINGCIEAPTALKIFQKRIG